MTLTFRARPPRPFLSSRGFTLLEFGLTLSIVGILVGGIWLAASAVIEHRKNAQIIQETVQIIQHAKRVFGNASTLPTLTGSAADQLNLINAGVFPAEMVQTVNGTTQAVGPYGNIEDILMTAGAFPALAQLRIRLPTTMPTGVCPQLLSALISTPTTRQQLGLLWVAPGYSGHIALPAGNIAESTIISDYCPTPGAANAAVSLYFKVN